MKTVKARFVNKATIAQIKEFEAANPTVPFENWVAGLAEHVLNQMGKHEDFDISKWQVFITNPDMIRKAIVGEAGKLAIPDHRLSVVRGGKERRISSDKGADSGKRSAVGRRARLKLVEKKNDSEAEILGEEAGEAEAE